MYTRWVMATGRKEHDKRAQQGQFSSFVDTVEEFCAKAEQVGEVLNVAAHVKAPAKGEVESVIKKAVAEIDQMNATIQSRA